MAIISFKYNFIFVKTAKTAGTSIEVDLSQRVEDEAIVTPIFPPSDAHRPRNYCQHNGTYFNHMTAVQIRELIGKDLFDTMVKFCVEREPVSKCISHFHMKRNSALHNENGSYVKDWDGYCRDGDFPVDDAKYCDAVAGRNAVIVDKILKYETLSTDLPDLMNDLGLPGFRLTAQEKSGYAQPRLVERDQVTKAQKDLIDAAFLGTRRLTGLYL